LTRQKFEELTFEVHDKLKKVMDKIERVILDLTIKFSKEV
jgi:hypothetical protein